MNDESNTSDRPREDEDRHAFAAEAHSLWRITFAPTVWALHFVLCYGLVSLSCAKELIPIATVQAVLTALSLLALAIIAWLGFRSLRQWRVLVTGQLEHPEGTPESRHRFLGHAAFLLSVISAIGVIFVSMPLILIGGCQ
ncbi:hypothetical protein C4N9_17835 [Pararhodobacter marinus]|uniref:Uncharacterized protein n=1 Tax=Pararhodobacter marinus TaxID=2184063 RepID=A0A2U2C5M7_9RHOB|nr:hypothetical protein [Pararhodobacter marinus]PWE27167.1 hypothetical protein C4N9_17835 [Pararhodobacter marinus]